jgi:Asp-tRNA(Asn)/Glu-tRNA(Gln) amidotransferase A subunit family amidase
MTNLHDLTAAEAARQIRRRDVSPVELVDALLSRIERSQPMLKAFVTVDYEGARAAARAAEAAITDGADLGPLHGVPFAAKDIYDAADLPTTAGYGPLANAVARADSFTVARPP